MSERDHIAQTILALLEQRVEGASICPSEVARALEPSSWRPLMPRVRAAAAELAASGKVELRQRGIVVEPFSEFRGPIRIALAAHAGRDAAG